jgi:DNA-binding transcriptional LysR family regulator
VELAHIRNFVALCDERSFTRAARRCGISQPSLSNAIKTLERELGGELFERRGMSLTPLGKSVQPQFESTLASVRQITKRAKAFHRRQRAQRRALADRTLRPDAAVLLNGAKPFEEAPESEAAHDRDGREDRADSHIVARPDR